MKFTLQLTPQDYIAARWLSLRPRPALRYLGYLVAALYFVSLLFYIPNILSGQNPGSQFWIQVGAGAYLAFIFFVLMPARIRKIFRQQKNLHVISYVDFTDTHMLGNSEHGSMKMKWEDFTKWKRSKTMVLIYQSDALMHMLPLRCVSDGTSAAEIFSFLESKLGKEKP